MSDKLMKHIRSITKWPATKDEITESYSKVEDAPEDEKIWLDENLPDTDYADADEVLTFIMGMEQAVRESDAEYQDEEVGAPTNESNK